MCSTHTHALTLLGAIASWKLKGYHKSALQSWCRATDPKDVYSNDFFCFLWGVLCQGTMTALGLGCLIWPKLRQTKKSRQKEKERDRNLLLFFILSLILQTVLHIFNKFAYFYNKNISKSATVPTLSSVPIYISSFYINQVISMEMTINRRLAPSLLRPERAF